MKPNFGKEVNDTTEGVINFFLRAAFKFGRRVDFALRLKMRKPSNTRVPAILNGLKIAQVERRTAFTRI